MEVKLKHPCPPCLKDQGRLHHRGKKSGYVCITHDAPPPEQHSTLQRGLPEPRVLPVEKENPGGQLGPPQNCGLLCGSPKSDLALWGLHWSLWVSVTRSLTDTEMVGGGSLQPPPRGS